MNRRRFIGATLAAATVPIPLSARIRAAFSKRDREVIGALAATILPEGDQPGTGADAKEVVHLLQKFFDETPAERPRFQAGLRRLEKRLTPGFPSFSFGERTSRLQSVREKNLPKDAAFALNVIRRIAVIELFSRRAGQDLLASPFRTAP